MATMDIHSMVDLPYTVNIMSKRLVCRARKFRCRIAVDPVRLSLQLIVRQTDDTQVVSYKVKLSKEVLYTPDKIDFPNDKHYFLVPGYQLPSSKKGFSFSSSHLTSS